MRKRLQTIATGCGCGKRNFARDDWRISRKFGGVEATNSARFAAVGLSFIVARDP